MSHLSHFMEENVLGIIEGPHVEDNHEGGADLQVFVKSLMKIILAKHLLVCRRA